jgi:dephospho-CoA kinase
MELGIPVIDADVLARELVAPGTPALEKIVLAFGSEILDHQGALDRARLRSIVFQQPGKRALLEDIVHPSIVLEMQRRISRLDAPYCVLCMPLLLETRRQDMVDRIVVVDVPLETQIQRTQERDGLSRSMVEKILAAQTDRTQRLAQADDVIENHGDLTHLRTQVLALHQRYLEIAQRKGIPSATCGQEGRTSGKS